MSQLPPPGYDDPTVIPKKRLENVVEKIGETLTTIGKVSQEYIPEKYQRELKCDFESLSETAEELEIAHLEIVTNVLAEYQRFQKEPRPDFATLQAELENLKIFLQD